ncbi:hypothetical protein MHU86_5855 [Fragilaria crotonensis]|nr:hypothetical protein MHU86_5855 [Fragilaria crotonensis]
MLTESQRTPEWFLRKFRITGTGAYAIWMLLSRYPDVDRDENINAVLRILSLLRTHEAVDDVVFTHERLSEMGLPDLREICRNKNLAVSGTKAAVIERYYQADATKATRGYYGVECANEDMVYGTLQIKSLL